MRRLEKDLDASFAASSSSSSDWATESRGFFDAGFKLNTRHLTLKTESDLFSLRWEKNRDALQKPYALRQSPP